MKKEGLSNVSALPILPQEAIEEILSRSPVKSLVRFRCVSKGWSTLLTTDSKFIQKHLDQTNQHTESHHQLFLQFHEDYFVVPSETFKKVFKKDSLIDTSYLKDFFVDGEDITFIVGSVNGLVCRCVSNDEWSVPLVSLWNPATKETKLLPHPKIKSPPDSYHITRDTFGFGFDPCTKDYKVIRLINSGDFHAQVQVYSLSSNTWRNLKDIHYKVTEKCSRANVNGIIHWLARRVNRGNKEGLNRDMDSDYEEDRDSHYEEDMASDIIISFDMTNEVIKEVPLLDDMNGDDFNCKHLRTFKGCLAIFCMSLDLRAKDEIHVWVMNEYPVKDSWAPLYIVKRSSLTHYPIGFSTSGKTLFHDHNKGLVSYNYESRKFKAFRNPKLAQKDSDFPDETDSSYYDAVPYEESLVSVLRTHNQAEEEMEMMTLIIHEALGCVDGKMSLEQLRSHCCIDDVGWF